MYSLPITIEWQYVMFFLYRRLSAFSLMCFWCFVLDHLEDQKLRQSNNWKGIYLFCYDAISNSLFSFWCVLYNYNSLVSTVPSDVVLRPHSALGLGVNCAACGLRAKSGALFLYHPREAMRVWSVLRGVTKTEWSCWAGEPVLLFLIASIFENFDQKNIFSGFSARNETETVSVSSRQKPFLILIQYSYVETFLRFQVLSSGP